MIWLPWQVMERWRRIISHEGVHWQVVPFYEPTVWKLHAHTERQPRIGLSSISPWREATVEQIRASDVLNAIKGLKGLCTCKTLWSQIETYEPVPLWISFDTVRKTVRVCLSFKDALMRAEYIDRHLKMRLLFEPVLTKWDQMTANNDEVMSDQGKALTCFWIIRSRNGKGRNSFITIRHLRTS